MDTTTVTPITAVIVAVPAASSDVATDKALLQDHHTAIVVDPTAVAAAPPITVLARALATATGRVADHVADRKLQ
jgi:hypothetical protein